ncbi:TIGR03790 family protein [Desulforapulum autotrophicum]|uniref:TIGR03790 family protein n=1 Tax=Desulforapulum autotrophicum TaxID=2296 RepID=UPI0006747F10|nr:TIGR03790 family protein [Desulforapulum autotrophicum]
MVSTNAFALGADEIVVLANMNASGSMGIAKYYMKERSIPEENLIKLWITDKEWCTREAFQQKVVIPVRRLLNETHGFKKVRCLVTTYGLPLKVSPPEMSQDQKNLVKSLKEKRYALGKEAEKIPKKDAEKRGRIQKELKILSDRILAISKKDYRSSFDSDDRSIHHAARGLRDKKQLKVVVDDNQTLFQPGDCPDAALYCGWYSHHQYIDAFKWVPGAVGYHIASSECSTLKNEKSQVWCKKMIDNGVAATLGPVGEPYLQSFPVPEMFFGLLAEGHLSLVECYTLSLPYLSWQMVLIGDPLYTPFKVQ